MLVVNLFAGPGAGKSTTAAATFAELKQAGVCAELVTEFAKDCAWEGREGPLRCQPYVFGEQLWRLERLRGRGVDVAVTDSPILLSAVYRPPGTPNELASVAAHYHGSFRNLNVFLRRARPYDTRGRLHTEDEARELDGRILETLSRFDRVHLFVRGDADAPRVIANHARSFL